MQAETSSTFEQWLAALRRAAEMRGVEWVVDPTGASHRAAFEAGQTPEDELQVLADMAEWRGCGCGGA